jgi:hypothetical protein
VMIQNDRDLNLGSTELENDRSDDHFQGYTVPNYRKKLTLIRDKIFARVCSAVVYKAGS